MKTIKQRTARKRARAKDRTNPCHVHKKHWKKPSRTYVLFDDLRNVYLVWNRYVDPLSLPSFKVKEIAYKLAALEKNATKTENIYELNNLIEKIGHTGKWRPIRIK